MATQLTAHRLTARWRSCWPSCSPANSPSGTGTPESLRQRPRTCRLLFSLQLVGFDQYIRLGVNHNFILIKFFCSLPSCFDLFNMVGKRHAAGALQAAGFQPDADYEAGRRKLAAVCLSNAPYVPPSGGDDTAVQQAVRHRSHRYCLT